MAERGSTSLAMKAGLWYVISTFLVKGLSFITTPIFARIMPEAAYGEFSNYASWQVTLLIITGAELHNTLSRAYYDFTDEYDSYCSSVTVLSALITLGFYVVFLLSRSWIFRIVNIPEKYVHILFVMLLFQACKNIFLARERTMYRYKTVAAISVINLVVPTAIAVALVVLLPESQALSGRIYGFYLPSAVIGGVCAALVMFKGRSCKLSHWKYALRLSLPLMLHYLTAYLLTSSNVIIAKNMMGPEGAALLSISSSTLHILTVLFQSLSGAVTTWTMDNLNAESYGKLRKGSIFYTGLLAVVAVGVILLAPEVVWVLGGSRYAEAVYLIPGLVLAVLIQSASSLFNVILTYDKNVTGTAVFTGIVAALSIAAKVFLVPKMGHNAFPAVNIAAFGLLFVINYILVRRAGYGKAVNIKAMAGVLLAVAAVSAVGRYLYANILLRWCIIGVVAVAALALAYKYRAVLLKLLKKRGKKK